MDTFALIADERRRLADALDLLDEADWAAPSLCDGWTAHVVAAHLNAPWEVKLPAVVKGLFAARGSLNGAFDRISRDLAGKLDPQRCVAGLRTHAEHRFTPPGSGPEAPLTDVVIHGADILTPRGRAVEVDPESLGVVLGWLARGHAKGFMPRSRIDGLALDATDVDVRAGSGAAVLSGPALAICGALLGRRVYLDQLTGAGVALLSDRI